MSDDILSIGQLARQAGVKTSKIRFYEDAGLMPPAVRKHSGQRVYVPNDLKRLLFITRCRAFGFSLDDVRELLSLSVSGERPCEDVAAIARGHLVVIRRQLAELAELERSLAAFVDACNAACCNGGIGRDCVVFDGIRGAAG